MKLGLIFISAIFGIFLGTGIALASMHHAPTTAPVVIPPVDKGITFELPAEPTVVNVAPVVITARAHHKPVARKQWVCGDMQALATGGAARTCEWR